jgi:hypothetical protein
MQSCMVVYIDQRPGFPIGPWKKRYTSPYMRKSVPVVLCQSYVDAKQ